MADVEGGQPTWAPGPNVPFSSQHFRTHSTTRHHSTRCCERCAAPASFSNSTTEGPERSPPYV